MKFALIVIALALIASSVVAQDASVIDPKMIKIPQAKMPQEAKESGLGGRVVVLVSIDEAGNVTAAEDATGPDWVCPAVVRPDVVALREAAKTAAMDAKFEPATRNGRTVASTMRLNFDFPRGEVNEGRGENISLAEDTKIRAVSPRDPNKYTVKGDINYSAANPSPPDYKGPVNTAASGEKNTIKGDGTAPMALINGGRPISGGVLNGKAANLPKPPYPPAARAVRASGAVNIQVLIDEGGKVFSAMDVSGHPLLRAASRSAACGAEFSPTRLMGIPVKVSGVITYNFIP